MIERVQEVSKAMKELIWFVEKDERAYSIVDGYNRPIGWSYNDDQMKSICDKHNKLIVGNFEEAEKTKLRRKYLTDIGWEPMDLPEDDSRHPEWEAERMEYGFDNRETWNLNSVLYDFLYERLMMFNEVNIIDTSFHTFEYEGKTLTLQECIDGMIESLKPIVSDEIDSWDEEYAVLSQKAMELLGLCHRALWW